MLMGFGEGAAFRGGFKGWVGLGWGSEMDVGWFL